MPPRSNPDDALAIHRRRRRYRCYCVPGRNRTWLSCVNGLELEGVMSNDYRRELGILIGVLIIGGVLWFAKGPPPPARMPEVSGLSWNAAKGCYEPTDKDWAPALLHPDVTEGDCEHGCVVAHTTTLQFEDCLKQCADAPQ